MSDAQSPPPPSPAAPSPTPTWSTTPMWFALLALACAVVGPDALWWAQAVGHEYARWSSWPAIAGAATCIALLAETVALLVRRDHGYLRPGLVLVAGGVVLGRTIASLGGFSEFVDVLNDIGMSLFGREGLSGRGYAMVAMLTAAAAGAYMGLLRLLGAQARRSAKNPSLARKVFYWIVLLATAGPAIWFVVNLCGSIFFKSMGESDAAALQRCLSRRGWAVPFAVLFAAMWFRYLVAMWRDQSRISVGIHAAIGIAGTICALPAVLMSFAMLAFTVAGHFPGTPAAIAQFLAAIFLASMPVIGGLAVLRFGALSIAAMVRRAAGASAAPTTPTTTAPAPATAPSSPGWLASLFVRAVPAPQPAVAPAAPAPPTPAPTTPVSTPVDAPVSKALVPVNDDVLDLIVADLLTEGLDFQILPEGIEVDERLVDRVMQIAAKHQRPAQKKAV